MDKFGIPLWGTAQWTLLVILFIHVCINSLASPIANQQKFKDSSLRERHPGRVKLLFAPPNYRKNSHLAYTHRQTRNTLEPPKYEVSEHKFQFSDVELKKRHQTSIPYSSISKDGKSGHIYNELERSRIQHKLHLQLKEGEHHYFVTDPSKNEDDPIVTIVKTPEYHSSGDVSTSSEQEKIKLIKTRYQQPNILIRKEGKSQADDEELERVRMASEHFMRMKISGKCHDPVPQVICVKDLHSTANKDYLPPCTILHRCSDKAGCCDSDTMHCQPKAIQEVDLYFYVVSPERKEHGVANITIERLLFDNHTECECQKKENLNHSSLKTSLTPTVESEHKVLGDHSNVQGTTERKCDDCPVPFQPRVFSDGSCTCDCFDRDRSCLVYKKGKETFDDIEKRCIDTGRCHIPRCEFGFYNNAKGRCPKKKENKENGVKLTSGYLEKSNMKYNDLE